MLNTFQIMFRGMEGSEPVRTEVRAWLAKLAPLLGGTGLGAGESSGEGQGHSMEMTGGHILIEATYQHHHGAGWRYQATLEILSPTGVTSIAADCPGNNPSDDIYVAVRNVFRCVRRTVQADLDRRPSTPVAVVGQTPPIIASLGPTHLETNGLSPVEVAEG